MKFLTLIEIEIKKLLPWMLSLFITLSAVSTGLFYKLINKTYQKEILPQIMQSSLETYVKENGRVSLTLLFDSTPVVPLLFLLSAILLVCFAFYLWYKEWFGASKRIYMLLTLKGSRFKLFLSKLIVTVFSVFCFYGVILLNLGALSFITTLVFPKELIADQPVTSLLQYSNSINLILPLSIGDFIHKIGFIILMFSLISFFVLCDRSKKVIGIICGGAFLLANIALFFYTKTLYLYMDERLVVDYGFAFVMNALTMGLCTWLINKKVSI